MRIRELLFRNFRSFRGERRISFVDPLTDAVRPVSVIAGTNGTGKTTIFQAIEALLAYVLEPENPRDLVREAWETGLVCLSLELSPEDLPRSDTQPTLLADLQVLHIVVGQRGLARFPEREWPNLFCRLVQREVSGRPFVRKSPLADRLRRSVSLMHQGKADLRGGLLYFPHDRRLGATRGGAIEPPPEERQWLFRFSASDRWQGSLEQLWVWQNYLDLEQGTLQRDNLKPFVETVHAVLGDGRPIAVRDGRVWVPATWSGDGEPAQVRLDQLPSGEQQVLLLFGELARRRRRGAVIAIDEAENSLHPTLQRLVVHHLRRLAREWDTQLVLATHSLEVLRAVHESERVILDRLEDPTVSEGER
jgi:energy-coupling factor transporter ATP-binding protein EcfA2